MTYYVFNILELGLHSTAVNIQMAKHDDEDVMVGNMFIAVNCNCITNRIVPFRSDCGVAMECTVQSECCLLYTSRCV